jgi:hypothetical protein
VTEVTQSRPQCFDSTKLGGKAARTPDMGAWLLPARSPSDDAVCACPTIMVETMSLGHTDLKKRVASDAASSVLTLKRLL